MVEELNKFNVRERFKNRLSTFIRINMLKPMYGVIRYFRLDNGTEVVMMLKAIVNMHDAWYFLFTSV